jgi:hypothetical protein
MKKYYAYGLCCLFLFGGCSITAEGENVAMFAYRIHEKNFRDGQNLAFAQMPRGLSQARQYIRLAASDLGFKEVQVEQSGSTYMFFTNPKTKIRMIGSLGWSRRPDNSFGIFLEYDEHRQVTYVTISEKKYVPWAQDLRHDLAFMLQNRGY